MRADVHVSYFLDYGATQWWEFYGPDISILLLLLFLLILVVMLLC